MSHLIKRNIENNDIKEIIKLAWKCFPHGHGWNEYLQSIEGKECKIYYCEVCNVKILASHDGFIYFFAANCWKNQQPLKFKLKDINNYSCDEWIIKNILE